MFAAGSDPEVWAVHPVSDRYKEPAFREFFDGALASGSGFSFVDRATGKVIGSSRYYGHDAEKREIEIGWTFLAKAYWGGSYNGEIKRLMLDYAFTFVTPSSSLLARGTGFHSGPWRRSAALVVPGSSLVNSGEKSTNIWFLKSASRTGRQLLLASTRIWPPNPSRNSRGQLAFFGRATRRSAASARNDRKDRLSRIATTSAMAATGRWAQPVDATHWLNRSAGDWKSSVFLGRSLS